MQSAPVPRPTTVIGEQLMAKRGPMRGILATTPPVSKLRLFWVASKVDVQHFKVPLLQLSVRAAMGSGAAATTEERARTGKRRADGRMNILAKLWGLER